MEEEEDRISQLPEHILHHHILSLLPQNDAVRTFLLSKSWRHLGPTRPKIEFDERSAHTLQRYCDQKFSIQEFVLILRMLWTDDSMEEEDRISQLPQHILQNHILSLLPQDAAVRTCVLSKSWRHLGPTRPKIEFRETCFPGNKHTLQSVFAHTLQRYCDQKLPIQELVLRMLGTDCGSKNSNSLLNKWIVKLHMLKRLSLHYACVEEETLERIMSSCPLIQHLVLESCYGLTTVKVNKARNLKHFDCGFVSKNGSIEINDAPSLETISIRDCRNWYHLHNDYFFPRLRSLYLRYVHLPTELLNNLSSNNCPSLEELELNYCSGFTEEFKLSNRSIKRLIIRIDDRPIKAAIDAANMLYFEFAGVYLPSFSFGTTLREWKSRIRVACYSDSIDDIWYLELFQMLKALSQSKISLDITKIPRTSQDTYDGGGCEPVVVEHLHLSAYFSSFSSLEALLNCLFRICRPRYIRLPFYSNSQNRQLAESVWKTLVEKGETKLWQQDLEESNIQVSDKSANEWRPVQVCESSNNEQIRLIRLKWRDFS